MRESRFTGHQIMSPFRLQAKAFILWADSTGEMVASLIIIIVGGMNELMRTDISLKEEYN